MDMSESVHRKLSMLAAKTGRKKVDQSADAVGGWAEKGGIGVGFVYIVRSLYIMSGRLTVIRSTVN